jgi:uncharacterized protein CbrC (UPF0167 family)
MTLPKFRYHPDPIASGSIVGSNEPCRGCGNARGYVYAGPIYSEAERDEQLCPWCIADGSAHGEFHALFADAERFGEGIPAGAATRVLNALSRERGPTVYLFRWLTCEAACFHIDGP